MFEHVKIVVYDLMAVQYRRVLAGTAAVPASQAATATSHWQAGIACERVFLCNRAELSTES